ncbi:MAG: hypothetical protein IPO38_06090 [Rhodocyclaceae bacterium]|nr:hypothetical protein [Rhodocyclaceae bacterium]
MFAAISWFLVLTLLAFWSLGVWVTHALVAWSMIGVSALAGQPQTMVGLVLPESIAQWVPADMILVIKSTAAVVAPFVESALAALPSLADWLAPLAWGIWGLGALVLVVIGAVLHAIIHATMRRAANQ